MYLTGMKGGTANSTSLALKGQIYVEKLSPNPAQVEQPLPIIFIAGAAQSGTNFLETPDGRPGWASYFINKGHTIYLSDQPSRGRSFWFPGQGSLGIIGLPALHVIVFDPGAYRTIEDDTARTKWSTSWQRAEQVVMSEAYIFDSRVDKRSVAGIADFVVFDLCAVGLDAVAS